MPKRPPARFDPPMPIGPIRNAAALASCSGSVYRATLALCLAYWSGACRDLPTDDVSLATLARLPLNALRLHKAETQSALAEILPALAFTYAIAKHRHDRTMAHMKSMAAKSAMTGRLADPANRPTRFQPAKATDRMPIAPIAAQPHRNANADMPALRAVRIRQRNAGPQGLLRDTGS